MGSGRLVVTAAVGSKYSPVTAASCTNPLITHQEGVWTSVHQCSLSTLQNKREREGGDGKFGTISVVLTHLL